MFSEQFVRMLEYPQAIIKCDTRVIQLKCSDQYTGYLYIENDGYGTLSCDICSDLSMITFSPAQWSNNSQTVTFEIDTTDYKIGDMFSGEIVISSNGGEIIIPVKIEVVPVSLAADDEKIYSPADFYNLVKSNISAAKRLFTSPAFASWLQRNESHFYNIYTKIFEDTNKDRALENFLVACDFKQKTELILVNDFIEVSIPSNAKREFKGVMQVKKSSNGFVECIVESRFDSAWLKILKHKLTDSDFNDDLIAEVPFIINPLKLKNASKNYNKVEFITDDTVLECNIVALIKKWIRVRLNRQSYRLEDEGTIIVENNSGADALVEVSSSENFVKFTAKRYLISRKGEIPFTVKVGGLLSGAGFAGFFQKPHISSEISLKITVNGVLQKETVTLLVGNLIQM